MTKSPFFIALFAVPLWHASSSAQPPYAPDAQWGDTSNPAQEPAGSSGAACTTNQIVDCGAEGGTVSTDGGVCSCTVRYYVPRRVVNAEDGDVGLVPSRPGSGSGNELVALVLGAAGQLHRHTVMFWDDGQQTRHSTMYFSSEDDGYSAGSDYVTVNVGAGMLNEDKLRNGLPGFLSQTVDQTFLRGRLEWTGLILKPGSGGTSLSGSAHLDVGPSRADFEAAVAYARSQQGYYKLSDYTEQTSIELPYHGIQTGDQRGSHCSGYVAQAFAAQGLVIDEVEYDRALRELVGGLLYDEVRYQVRHPGNWLISAGASVLGLGNRIGNQVVNCFAGLGCDNPRDSWRAEMGEGHANSPDNLLPRSFQLSGDRDYIWYHWSAASIPHEGVPGGVPGFSVLTSDYECGDASDGRFVACTPVHHDNPNGTTATPFRRVEAQVMTGGYWVDEVIF